MAKKNHKGKGVLDLKDSDYRLMSCLMTCFKSENHFILTMFGDNEDGVVTSLQYEENYLQQFIVQMARSAFNLPETEGALKQTQSIINSILEELNKYKKAHEGNELSN